MSVTARESPSRRANTSTSRDKKYRKKSHQDFLGDDGQVGDQGFGANSVFGNFPVQQLDQLPPEVASFDRAEVRFQPEKERTTARSDEAKKTNQRLSRRKLIRLLKLHSDADPRCRKTRFETCKKNSVGLEICHRGRKL